MSLFHNFPKACSHEQYTEIKDRIVSVCEKYGDVAAIYQYGTISHPGISDLDLILVFNGNLKISLVSDYNFHLNAPFPIGTVMKIPEKDFKNFHWFDHGIHLEKVWGEDIKISEIPEKYHQWRLHTSIIEWLIDRISRLILLKLDDSKDVCEILGVTRSLLYTLEHLPIDSEAFKGSVISARKGCNPDTLLELIDQGCEIAYEALVQYAEYSKDVCPDYGVQGAMRMTSQRCYLFYPQHQCTVDNAVRLSMKQDVYIPVPIILKSHYASYLTQPGFLADKMRMRSSIRPDILPDDLYQGYIERKTALATSCGLFLRQNGFTDGLFRLGTYL